VPELDPPAVSGAYLLAAGEGRDAENSIVIRLGARIWRRLVTRRVVLLLVLSVVLVGGWLARRNRLLRTLTPLSLHYTAA
jgi:hypothetical protein